MRIALCAAVAVLLLGCAGCGLSDPVRPPAGVRLDDGVLMVLIQECGEIVQAARVIPIESASESPPVWSASGFLGNGEAMRFDAGAWTMSSGKCSAPEPIGAEVQTSQGIFWVEFSGESDWTAASDLPPEIYLVHGKRMSSADYQTLAESVAPCG